MATIRILLGIICLAAFGWSGLPGSSVVESRKREVRQGAGGRSWEKAWVKNRSSLSVDCLSLNILTIAQSQLGVRERTGNNDGQAVEQYLNYVGFKIGAPWCAAFVSWVFGSAGCEQPNTAWSPALFPLQKQTTEVKPATVFGIYFPSLKRIAHCGFVERLDGHWVITIEGNTNVAGSREGDGVYRKRRLVNTIRYFADWTKRKEEPKHEKI